MEELGRFLASFRLGAPERLGLGVALLAVVFLSAVRKGRGLALDWRFWSTLVSFNGRWVWALRGMIAIACLLLALALADPQWVVRERIPIYGKPVLVVVDISGSMGYAKGQGETASGFERARQVVYGLLDRDLDADLGLLLYSSEHYIARYFASRKELLRDTLENTDEIKSISYGTRTALALAQARRFFTQKVHGQDEAILLISDLEEGPEGMAEIAKEMDRIIQAGIRLYAIVMGDGSLPDIEDTRLAPLRRKEVRMVGMDDRYAIDELCREVVGMARSPIREREIVERRSLLPAVLAPCLALVATALVLSETCLQKIP